MFENDAFRHLSKEQKKTRRAEIARVFLKLGTIAFGGPAAHTAMMEDELVNKRNWLTRDQFMDLVGATNLIPGPNSTELAMHLGYERGGMAGLFIAGGFFIIPAMLISLLFAWLYQSYGTMPQLAGILYGIKPAVIAIILMALWRLGKSAVKGWLTAAVALAATALSFIGTAEIWLLLGGGLVLMVIRNWQRLTSKVMSFSPLPLALMAEAGRAAEPMARMASPGIFLTFLKIGSMLYGSGYVLLAFLEREFVLLRPLLTQQQLLDAIALGQFKPGPVFTTATFVGYLLDGVPGAIAATVGIFLPPFLLVLLLNPLIPKLRKSPWLSAALDGINAASLGLMLVVTIRLGLASLIDPFTIVLFVAALVAVMKYKVNAAWVVLAGAVLGWAYTAIF